METKTDSYLKVSITIFLSLVFITGAVCAATTEVHVARYASDGVTILDETTLTYQEMMGTLPVTGDGETHYYHQGPVFADDPDPEVQEMLRWNPEEDSNVLEKDMGAVKGTNLKDLCDLVGGMSSGEIVEVKASDGLSRPFAYENVYGYSSREGPIVVTWHCDGNYPDTGYADGMRLVWFADTSVNPFGVHAFGNWDWHEAAAEEYWYYYYGSPTEKYPTTTGLSVKYISDILIYSDDPAPADVIYEGNVTLADGTFTWTDSDGTDHTIPNLTPHGALEAASHIQGFTYGGGWTGSKSTALIDWIDSGVANYTYDDSVSPKLTWNYQLNGVYQNYFSGTTGISNNPVADGDHIEFYYGPDQETTGNATAVIRLTVNVEEPSGPDVLYEGEVLLSDGTFTWTDSDGTDHVIPLLTPHGALEAASHIQGFTYGGGWTGSKSTALIDWIDSGVANYTYDDSVSPKLTWNYQLNGVYQNYFSGTTGVSNNPVADGDYIEFYYGPDQQTTGNATAVIRITVVEEHFPTILFWGNVTLNPGTFDFIAYNSGVEYQIDSLTPHGALDAASKIAGFEYNATDKKWASMGTMLLDDVAEYNYDSSVTPKLCWAYEVNGVKKNDFSSTEGISVYRVYDGDVVMFYYGEDGDTPDNATALIIATVNISEQDVIFDDDVTLVPGTFNFTAYNSGLEYQIDKTTPHGALEKASQIGGFVYNATDKKWSTMGTMLLDDVAEYNYDSSVTPKQVWAYAVNGVIKNDYSSTEGISVYPLANNDRVEFFFGDQGGTLANATAVVRIRVHISSQEDWTLLLDGALTEEIDREYFEEGVACIHSATYDDLSGTWEGMPLWDLVGYVDDQITHGPGAFNDTRAAEGYQVKITASDGFNVTFDSQDIARNDDYIIANILNGEPLLEQHWPLKLVGPAIVPSQSISKITEIELIGVEPVPPSAGSVHIIKYGPDGVTIIDETNVTVEWMEQNLDVIGDGVTHYRFQGITGDPEDLWDPNETKGMDPPKIDNAVKGTRVKELCDLVGGMGTGTDIKFIASDGYETTLGYSNIYPNPYVQERQGDAILAWYADGEYIPDYTDGIRLFFTPNDTVFGQWDMHECMDEQYWHYYYQSYPSGSPYYPGVMYPSCAGLSAKFITTIEIYSEPTAGWTLELDGTALGGLHQDISRVYFEQALACQFGAEHSAEYTDGSGRTWGGIPLWFLCGFVDDQDMHSDNAYNDTLALAGYDIVITAGDGYNSIIDSRDTVRNSNYIVANTLNKTPFADTDSNWPLRLAGANVSGGLTVKNIEKIELIPKQGPGFTAILEDGWNTLSTPVLLDSEHDTFYEIFDPDSQENIEVILGWNGQQWFIPDSEYMLVPLEAVFVKVDGTATSSFVPSETVSSLPTRYLEGGIHLIGPAPAYSDGVFPATPVNEALISIEYAPGGLIGYTIVVSPAYNQPGWSYPRGGTVHDVLPYKGYWVVMENPDTLYGFSTTPIG